MSRNGNSYIASQASTNQDPSTQTAYWVLLASKGDTGAGDVTASNNLSDLANKKTAKDNLSLRGTAIASGSTVDLEAATGDYLHITGTTTITAVTLSDGHERTVVFDSVLTLTHGSSLILETGASILTAAGDVAVFRGEASGVVRCVDYVRANGRPLRELVAITVAASDESTNLTTGTSKIKFRMPYAMTVTEVRASLSTAQTAGSVLTVDVNEAGSSIISTKLTFDNNEATTVTAATPPVISDALLADDAKISIDIDQVGTAGARGLKVTLIGYRA